MIVVWVLAGMVAFFGIIVFFDVEVADARAARRRRKHVRKPDYARIRRLEAELGMTLSEPETTSPFNSGGMLIASEFWGGWSWPRLP